MEKDYQLLSTFGCTENGGSQNSGAQSTVDERAPLMLPIIRQHVWPDTMVYSHEWCAYNQVGSIPVNHSLFFVDPVTGVHTQTIESYWNRIKTKLKTTKGAHRDMN